MPAAGNLRPMLTIDGSYGEGGGQVLRTCLSLAAISGQAFRLTQIRAGRDKPGLAAQHLTCVRAAVMACSARVEGDGLGSRELTFRPGAPRAGEYLLDVADVRPSAGSVNLILQTVLPILMRCDGPSRVVLRGGTHVPWSPTFEYVASVFLPALARFGVRAAVELNRAGFYPRGGGEEVLGVEPSPRLTEADFTRVPGAAACQLLSRTTRLPAHVGARQMSAMRAALAGRVAVSAETTDEMPGPAPGTTVIVTAEQGWAGCSALGAKGKPAEQVGREAAEAFLRLLASGALVDAHLADQLLLYAALAEGTTRLAVEAITEHTRT
ncbi:MAG: RNA 3'-phosphate cyclase, partial [Armatimonadetes bacterium]|nr:RNA 3'-phosphate cyclase [Armatimonadota bacterium]